MWVRVVRARQDSAAVQHFGTVSHYLIIFGIDCEVDKSATDPSLYARAHAELTQGVTVRKRLRPVESEGLGLGLYLPRA